MRISGHFIVPRKTFYGGSVCSDHEVFLASSSVQFNGKYDNFDVLLSIFFCFGATTSPRLILHMYTPVQHALRLLATRRLLSTLPSHLEPIRPDRRPQPCFLRKHSHVEPKPTVHALLLTLWHLKVRRLFVEQLQILVRMHRVLRWRGRAKVGRRCRGGGRKDIRGVLLGAGRAEVRQHAVQDLRAVGDGRVDEVAGSFNVLNLRAIRKGISVWQIVRGRGTDHDEEVVAG